MSNRRSLIGASLVAGAIAVSAGGCSSTVSQDPAATAAPVSSSSSTAAVAASRPQPTAVSCSTSRRVLTDLQTFGNGTSLDSAALDQLNSTLSDLKELAQTASTTEMASLAASVHTALTGIKSLAQTDPQGAQASTRDRARTLEQQYLSSSQQLSSEIARACP